MTDDCLSLQGMDEVTSSCCKVAMQLLACIELGTVQPQVVRYFHKYAYYKFDTIRMETEMNMFVLSIEHF